MGSLKKKSLLPPCKPIRLHHWWTSLHPPALSLCVFTHTLSCNFQQSRLGEKGLERTTIKSLVNNLTKSALPLTWHTCNRSRLTLLIHFISKNLICASPVGCVPRPCSPTLVSGGRATHNTALSSSSAPPAKPKQNLENSLTIVLFCLGPHPQHLEVSRPETEPKPQLWLQWLSP